MNRQTPYLLPTLVCALTLLAWVYPGAARAQLTIEVTGGVEAAQPIAIVPFGAAAGQTPPVDVAAVIAADLARTGRFRPLPTRDMLDQPTTHEAVDLRDWRLLGTNNLVIGRVEPDGNGIRVSFILYDVFGGTQLLETGVTGSRAALRHLAHRAADLIYEKLTGQRGISATRIAYVTSTGTGDNQTVTLRVADADGANPQTIVSSAEPIMSPAWSPDGRRIAYVSFEHKRAAIYIQDLSSGRREMVASHTGINGSPAFSPEGRRLAITLSKDGNPDIYLLDLSSRALTRLTDHFAIDTEPSFSPDGQHIVFTSDRGGSPQIYRMSASGGPATRISAQGNYNGRASYAPDGRTLAMVSRIDGRFRIATLNLATGEVRPLSNGSLDESPSFAPNGSMVIYATMHGGRGTLAAVSVDGGGNQRLSQDAGQVREPAWSPFMP